MTEHSPNLPPDRRGIAREDITAIILAGGAGSRLGGIDKAWAVWRGRPLVEHVIERIRPQVGSIVVSANRHVDRYRHLNVAVVRDLTGEFSGPLAGVRAAWAQCPTPWVMIVPVDAPQIAENFVSCLAEVAQRCPDERTVVACDASGPQPLFCLMHRNDYPALLRYWLHGGRSMLDWLDTIGAIHCRMDAAAGSFQNLNTWDDFL